MKLRIPWGVFALKVYLLMRATFTCIVMLKAIFSASFSRISSVIFSGFRFFFGFLFFWLFHGNGMAEVTRIKLELGASICNSLFCIRS